MDASTLPFPGPGLTGTGVKFTAPTGWGDACLVFLHRLKGYLMDAVFLFLECLCIYDKDEA